MSGCSLLNEDVEERAAIAQVEGGFPIGFAEAFARLQTIRPDKVDPTSWQAAVDAMGYYLDAAREDASGGTQSVRSKKQV